MMHRPFVAIIVACLFLAAAGCKKKEATVAGPSCAQAVSHSMALSKDEMKKLGTDDALMQKLVDLGVKRCTEDKWSPEAIKCMVDAKAMADAQSCYGKLTNEQQAAMNNAAIELAMPSHEAATGSSGSGSAGGSGDAAGSAGPAAGSGTTAGSGSAAGASEASAAGSAGSAAK